mmetsp:Transcript_6729/g.14850  ORF Transcript_6729/g.14850 Transcript_6729/m.14850 type:complete len:310 (+) Transcript_6729:88-1017(+)
MFALQHPLLYGLLGCAFATSLYVGLLYIWRGLPRDHPLTIKKRMLSVLLACVAAWLPLYWAYHASTSSQVKPLTQLLGLTLRGMPLVALLPLALTMTFFAGPLLYDFLHDPTALLEAPITLLAYSRDLTTALLGLKLQRAMDVAASPFADRHLLLWRNLVVAPLSEEFVFRGCMVPLLLLQGSSKAAAILLPPLFFGAAHLHHLHDLLTYQRVAPRTALPMVLFQFTYTTVFGWYECLLFINTGSLVAPVVVHMFCNLMGVPHFGRMMQQGGSRPWVPLLVTGLGVAGFAALFKPLTSPLLYTVVAAVS